MLKLGALFRKFCAFGRGILVFAVLLIFGLVLRLLPVSAKETLSSAMLSSVFYPVQSVLAAVDDFHGIIAENERLKEQNARLRFELDEAREGLRELVRLRALVRFDNHWEYPIVTARVVGRNPGRIVTTLVINRGTSDGIAKNMPVFSMKGVVGRVSKVTSNHAQVQILTDPTVKVSVLNVRTRTIGFAENVGDFQMAASVPAHSGMVIGDTVVTSGLGGIFPRGLGVGVVERVDETDEEVVSTMYLRLFQDVGSLEEVFVMGKEPDWTVRELSE